MTISKDKWPTNFIPGTLHRVNCDIDFYLSQENNEVCVLRRNSIVVFVKDVVTLNKVWDYKTVYFLYGTKLIHEDLYDLSECLYITGCFDKLP